jgi:membrane-bound serine protease (ClpP class)
VIGWIFLLFAVGVALILTEFFMPGLVMGTIGVLCLISSIVMAVVYERELSVFIIVLEAIGLVGAIGLGMYLMPRTRAGKALILQSSQRLDDGWTASETDTTLVGEIGEAFTTLRPAGTIVVNKKRLSAVTGGDYIEQGAAVRVIEVHGNRVVVERV